MSQNNDIPQGPSLGSEEPGSDSTNKDRDASLEPPARPGKSRSTGTLAWMGRNSVAANILMLILLVGGALMMRNVKQEVFPEFQIEQIIVNVIYPGASPEEVEQGVILAIEEQVRGIDGVKEVRSTAAEGAAVVTVELLLGADADQALNEVKAAVDRITSFPDDIERPVVFMPTLRNQVIGLVVHGKDASPHALKLMAENVRDALLQNPQITVVDVGGLPELEISIEISQDNLRRYGFTIDQIAALVRQASVELPGGAIKTSSGEILLRTTERRDFGHEFASIVLRSNPDGSKLYLGDIAQITDGFAETDQEAYYNGERAVMLSVFRVGDQTPIEISKAVHQYVAESKDSMPPGMHLSTWFDTSEFYRGRMDLLIKNAIMGLILVMLVLGMFLEIRLAFWVTMGIPVSFIGSFLFLPITDVSINMISMFAFILVLGMVVDDAIVVGEQVYTWRQQGMSRMKAAIIGVKGVSMPVTFAIATTVIAYLPLLFIPGLMGKFFRVIPIVVITVLLISLFESLFILPAHLAHSKKTERRGIFGFIHHQQERFSLMLERHIRRLYIPTITATLRRRYLAAAIGFTILLGTLGLVAGGRVAFEPFPSVASDVITATIEMPYGTALARTRDAQERLLAAAREVIEENGGLGIVRGIYANIGAAGLMQAGPGGQSTSGTHLAEVALDLVPADSRPIDSETFTRLWRERVGEIAGARRVQFNFSTGPGAGAPLSIELSHPDIAVLRAAATELADKLREFAGTYDIDDGFENGKEQLDLTLRPEARAFGLSETDLARQIRGAFFGAEAVRQQRGRDEVRVYVRLPRSERDSEYNVEELIVRTPMGGELPLAQAAEIERGYSYTTIRRINGRRAVSVSAHVDPTVNNAENIKTELFGTVMPAIIEKHSGLRYGQSGDAREFAEAFGSLFQGLGFAMIGIFALLAVAFRSYIQPLIVMMAIPFGIVGAVFGHLLLGFNMSLMSMMGIVALAGVVVNDSLILIVAINQLRANGMPIMVAVVDGGIMRFRPILLTSLTTFFGLTPMIFETSIQAVFLIPMALSLGFGVMFATFITLLLVPVAYVIVDDIKRLIAWFKTRLLGLPPPAKEDHDDEGGSDLMDLLA